MTQKTIAVGCDHGGFDLKEKIVRFLEKKGFRVIDVGTFSKSSMDYPDTAYEAAALVSGGKVPFAILICKTGIGNCMVANKLKKVRAALVVKERAARLARLHNDANVLVLGALFVKEAAAKRIITTWLRTPFKGGRHLRRLKKIERIEKLCAKR